MRLFDFDVHVTCTMDVSINIYKLELYLTGVTFFSLIDINRIEYIQIQFIKYFIKTTPTVYLIFKSTAKLFYCNLIFIKNRYSANIQLYISQ